MSIHCNKYAITENMDYFSRTSPSSSRKWLSGVLMWNRNSISFVICFAFIAVGLKETSEFRTSCRAQLCLQLSAQTLTKNNTKTSFPFSKLPFLLPGNIFMICKWQGHLVTMKQKHLRCKQLLIPAVISLIFFFNADIVNMFSKRSRKGKKKFGSLFSGFPETFKA